ncbi:MAG: hypothetical protein HYX76_09130 [Acidobacteria bacterium]|nr:hypothetical protein [Acidobacteriota bacterium]
MERSSVEGLVESLNRAGVRYLIAGGLAVVAHGYVRFTADVDLIVDLEPANVRRALTALQELGYRPRAPVAIEQFADPDARASWGRDKGLTVFSLFSRDHPMTEVDLFVEPPLEFGPAYLAAMRREVAPGLEAVFVGLSDLIDLKRRAGRAQDRLDVERLQALHGLSSND